jgi:hypothetical protein
MMRLFKPKKFRTKRDIPALAPTHGEQPMVDVLPIGPGMIYPDMLPEKVWGSTLRGILSKADWDRLRMPICEAAGNRCEVCSQLGYDPDTGKARRPDCHKLWHFEVSPASAVRLARLIALCPDCHRVQHAGRAAIRGELPIVVEQLRTVNTWNASEIRLALDNVIERYQRRRQFDWDLDLSLLAGQARIREHPDLFIPRAARRALGIALF